MNTYHRRKLSSLPLAAICLRRLSAAGSRRVGDCSERTSMYKVHLYYGSAVSEAGVVCFLALTLCSSVVAMGWGWLAGSAQPLASQVAARKGAASQAEKAVNFKLPITQASLLACLDFPGPV